MVDELTPSEIRYCQSSIRPIFFNGDRIGETHDEILEDELDIDDIRTMKVCRKGSRWKTIHGSPGYELDTILKGDADISVPALPVVQFLPENKDEDSRYYVLRNNSKLWILKKAEKLGLIEDDLDVDVKIKDIIHEEEELFEHLFDIRSGKRIYNEADLGGKLWKKKLRLTERKDDLLLCLEILI
ncbi:unnamed protein product [Mytilus coruscus]|uniref:Uncharacterized protein n=1 Tax=Mytilus coruscus TaxID=42192 RepID=A0A6J8DBZ3_MYTCO|nr:unnamed protein product [Mytilus coruscus]